MGFHKPDEGRIFLGGVDATETPPEKKGIGYVSQNCVLFPHLTVRQNVEFGLKMRGVEQLERKKAVAEVLETVGLLSLDHRKPATLSGGEKQKVALARVLAINPNTILLDEPLTAIDPESARELKSVLKQIHRDGKTILHVTHNQIEGFSLGNKMAVMRVGEILQSGTTKELFVSPKDEFVARFLGYENIFKAKLVEDGENFSVVSVDGVKLKVSAKLGVPACIIAIRPEDIAVYLSPKRSGSMNILEASVSDFTDQGSLVAVSFDAALKLQATMTKSVFIEKSLEAGQKVWLSFKTDAVKILR
jgi:molybdate/tungstate transport system ATP-binding protein